MKEGHKITYMCHDRKGEAAMPTVICKCGWSFELADTSGSARWIDDALLDAYGRHRKAS